MHNVSSSIGNEERFALCSYQITRFAHISTNLLFFRRLLCNIRYQRTGIECRYTNIRSTMGQIVLLNLYVYKVTFVQQATRLSCFAFRHMVKRFGCWNKRLLWRDLLVFYGYFMDGINLRLLKNVFIKTNCVYIKFSKNNL